MPSIQGISMHLETRVWVIGTSLYVDGKLFRFPEYPYRMLKPIESTTNTIKTSKPLLPSFMGGSSKAAGSKHSPSEVSDGEEREVSVYIPLLPKATRFRVAYSFIVPFEEGLRLEYRLFFNGKLVVSGQVTPQKMPRGYIGRAIVAADGGASANKKASYEAMSFEFVVPTGLFKSRAEDGGLIEVQWFRIEHTNPSDPKGLQPTMTFKDKYSIRLKTIGAAASVKHRNTLLKDAVDSPFATFKFYYRSWQSLREHHIVEDDGFDENTSQVPPIGNSTRSLRSFQEPPSSPTSRPGMTIGNPRDFKHIVGSRSLMDNCIPVGMAQRAHFTSSVIPHDIRDTTQGRLVAQSNAKAQRRLSALSERAPKKTDTIRGPAAADLHGIAMPPAPRSRRNTMFRPLSTGDRRSMASLSPSLKECVDREEMNSEDSVLSLGQAVELRIPKGRGQNSGHHTGISAQFAALRAHDESSSLLDYNFEQENNNRLTPRRPRPTGIYQHDNAGLPHYGEHGLSSLTMSEYSGHDDSSVIDENFAASAFAPPTRGTMSAATFRPPSTGFLTPNRYTQSYLVDSSPTKTPGGGEFPVDPPGSDGFPVIEPGEILELSPSDGSEPGFYIDGGESSLLFTPPNAFPRGLKPYGSLSRFGNMSGAFSSSPRLPSASSPLVEIEQLNLSGTVKRRVSAYESPHSAPVLIRRRNLTLPAGRALAHVVIRAEAEGKIAPPRFGGPLSATPSAIALTDRKFGEAKAAIADLKSRIEAHRDAFDEGGRDQFSQKSWTADDEDLESSGTIKRVSKTTQALKENLKNIAKDVFTTSGMEFASRRRPSSEDDPHHPMRRRSSTVKMTAQDWFAPGRDAMSLPIKSSLQHLLSPFASPKRKLEEVSEFGGQLVLSSNGPLIVAPHLVSNTHQGPETAITTAEAGPNVHLVPYANSHVEAAVPAASVVRVPNYAERIVSIVPPVSRWDGGGEEEPSLEALCIDPEAVSINTRLIEEMQRDGAALLQAAAARHGIRPSMNVVEAVRGRAVRHTGAASLSSRSGGPPVEASASEHGVTAGNLLNLENPDPQGWVEHRGSIINPSGPNLRDAETVIGEIRRFNASPEVAYGNYPRIHESQVDEYRAKPPAWIPLRIRNAKEIANAKSRGKGSAKGKEKAEPEEQPSEEQGTTVLPDVQPSEEEMVQRAIANSLATAFATTPATGASSSTQHNRKRPSPRTPRGQVSGALSIPIRTSSLRHGEVRSRHNDEGTPTRAAVTPPPRPSFRTFTPSSARASPPATPVFRTSVINRPHPLGSPLTRSSSFMERGQARLVSVTRSPSSGLVSAEMIGARTAGNAFHAHPAALTEQAEVAAHGHPAPVQAAELDVPRTAFGIPIRTANAADLFAASRVPSFSIPSHLLPAPERSPETLVPGAWPKSPVKEDDE